MGKNGDSNQKPTYKIYFDGGKTKTYTPGKVASKGKYKTYTLKTGGLDYGAPTKVTMTASGKDGWVVSKLQVKSGERAWTSFGGLPQHHQGLGEGHGRVYIQFRV